MQKMNKKSNGRGAKRVNQDADCYMKPIRPSKAMMEALESEGLHVDWPDDIFVELKGTFSTKSGSEHAVLLDFSHMKDSVKTSADVDRHILPSACMRPGWNTRGYANCVEASSMNCAETTICAGVKSYAFLRTAFRRKEIFPDSAGWFLL